MKWVQVLLVVYALVVFMWAVRWAGATWVRRQLVFLTPDSVDLADDDCPFVSILVPARNEAATIANCVRALLAQDYGRFELIVVDDRSTDDTAAIVRRLAAKDGRVRLVKVAELPPGWTGKTHALQYAQQFARGEWLLFVDADTVLHPRNLRIVLAHARQHFADLVSLLPGQRCETFWEHVIQPLAGIQLMVYFPLQAVNADERPEAFANGQYLLISRRAYDRVGGHTAVRGQLVEDIGLARLVKRGGMRLQVALAPRLAETRMYDSLHGLLSGWSRIFYAAVDGRPTRLIISIVLAVLTTFTAFVVASAAAACLLAGVTTPPTWTFLALSVAHITLMAVVMPPLYALAGPRRMSAVWFPLASAMLIRILCRSVAMCSTHRVEWRGTQYGPEMLRKKRAA